MLNFIDLNFSLKNAMMWKTIEIVVKGCNTLVITSTDRGLRCAVGRGIYYNVNDCVNYGTTSIPLPNFTFLLSEYFM